MRRGASRGRPPQANAATAVVAGAVGQLAVNTAVAARGYDSAEAAVRAGVNPFVAPFVIALLSLGATFAGASTLWHAAERAYARSGESAAAEGTDDGGDGNSKGIVVAIGKPELPTRRHRRAALASLREALRKLRRDPALIALGTMNALYEAAMYTFVFMWTPALEKRAARVAVHGSDLSGGGVPHGLIFSAFMLSKMAGAQIYSALANRLSPQAALAGVFGVAVPCLLVPVALPSMYAPTLLAFCIFELTLGVYWPVRRAVDASTARPVPALRARAMCDADALCAHARRARDADVRARFRPSPFCARISSMTASAQPRCRSSAFPSTACSWRSSPSRHPCPRAPCSSAR